MEFEWWRIIQEDARKVRKEKDRVWGVAGEEEGGGERKLWGIRVREEGRGYGG